MTCNAFYRFSLLCLSLICLPHCIIANNNAEHKVSRACDFVNSIGVNTHFGYYDTQYGRYEEILMPRLIELGVKHIRDGTYNADVVHKYKEMGEQGIRLLLITSSDKAVERAKSIGKMLWGVEAVNEPDGGRKPGTWEQEARQEQRRLYESIKDDSATCQLPVVGLSLANIKDSPSRLGDISRWMDYGGMHPYAAGRHPSEHWGWGMSMDDALSEARKVSGEKPLVVTECGYHNKEENPSHPGVSEEAAAIYHLHLFFTYFNEGILRSYKYEFLDLKPDCAMSDMECHFGLVRSDGSVKPSFSALKNLLALLSDTDEAFLPRPLPLQLTSGDEAPVRSTLLQKSDGSWWLALFRPVSVYDLQAHRDIGISPIPVEVRLPCRMNCRLFRPDQSQLPFASFRKKRSITVELGAELVLVELRA